MSPTGTTAETATHAGTTRSTSASSCTGDTHAVPTADGSSGIALVTTSTNDDLTAQICPPSSLDCTHTRQRFDIAQTIEARRKGGSAQGFRFCR